MVGVFADHGDIHLTIEVGQPVNHVPPFREIGGWCLQTQLAYHDIVQTLLMQQQRNPVNGVGIHRSDDGLFADIGKQGNLATFGFRNHPVRAADQNIRLDADGAQFLDGMLGRLGLEFTGRADVGHQREMDEQAVFIAQFHPHLADRLKKGLRLDVTDGAADFNKGHVMPFAAQANHPLDFVGDVRDDLDRRAQIFALSFLADDVFVDLSGGPVVHLAHGGPDKPLVMPKIEIGFGTIIRDEDFTMLERAHGARIDVDVGVQFGQGHLEAASFEDGRQR